MPPPHIRPAAAPALSGETLLWRAHAAEGAAGKRHVGGVR